MVWNVHKEIKVNCVSPCLPSYTPDWGCAIEYCQENENTYHKASIGYKGLQHLVLIKNEHIIQIHFGDHDKFSRNLPLSNTPIKL